MLSRLGRATVALGLIAALPDVLAQDAIEPALESEPIPDREKQEAAQDSKPEANRKEAETDRIVPALNSIEGAIRDLKAEENATERDRQEKREVADLQAQQEMAYWAKVMAFATFTTIVLTFSSIFLIWRTLIYTRHAAEAAADGTQAAMLAAKEAQRTSDAAIAANDLNREAFIAEHRPWLKVDVGIDRPLIWDVNGARFKFVIVVENIGRAPALHVITESKIILLDFGDIQLDETQSLLADQTKKNSTYIGWGSTIFQDQKIIFPNFAAVNRDDINDHIAKNKSKCIPHDCIFPYLIGCVDYRSPSGTRHQTGFIYHIHHNKDGGSIGTFYPSEGDIQAEALRLIHWLKHGRID